jgi:hypothetical protein
MAISVNTVWEIRSTATAANVNGGGFVTGASGTDFSQQDAAQFNLTGATSGGAGNTVLHASSAATMVGNLARVISGTNFTAGWFEITSVSPGVSFTCSTNQAGTAITTGVGAAGVINIGGALSMASTFDDDIFEAVPSAGGNKFWVKSGTYVLGEAVAISVQGGSQKPHIIEGYQTTRGDSPKTTTRPIFNCGAGGFSLGANWNLSNMIFTGTSSSVLSAGSATQAKYCKFQNTSSTGSSHALSGSGDNYYYACEMQAINGTGVILGGTTGLFGCYIHDSVVGVNNAVSQANIISNCLIVGNKTHAIQVTGGSTNSNFVQNCTLYGHATPTGVGIELDTAITDFRITNNIIVGFVTGISHASAQTIVFEDYNDYYNNTTNQSNIALGAHSITTDPGFTSVAQLSGTTATTSGSILTQLLGDFSTVTDNQDYVYIISGTGITAGMYPITSHTATTITLGTAPGTNATADKVWRIITGRNFVPTGTAQAAPASFYGSGSTNGAKLGAVQATATTSTGGGIPHLGRAIFG